MKGHLAVMRGLPIIVAIMCYTGKCDYPKVQEIDSKDFIGEYSQSGLTAAFGDVNADKQTDVFVLSETGRQVLIFFGSEGLPSLSLYHTIDLDAVATSVVPADFDGDDNSDLLTTFKSGSSCYTISIYWGDENENETFKTDNAYKSSETFIDEPLVLDANADMIADLFVVFSNQTRGFLVGHARQGLWDFVQSPFKTRNEQQQLYDVVIPHSNAFIDLTGGGSANLFVTSKHEDKMVYEVWEGSSDGLILHKSIKTGDSEYFKYPNIKISPAAFADFNGNGKQDILVAVCGFQPDSGKCNDGKILIFTNDKWHILYSVTDEWSFPNTENELEHEQNTLHISDFNLDSYPDVLTVMENKDGIRKAVLFYSDLCNIEACALVGRQLAASLEMPNSDNTVLSAFYDFNMDGTLDVIVTTKTEPEKYTLQAYKNMIADDVTFLRVQVLSGHSEKAIFGVNVPGPQIAYQTTNTTGAPQRGCLGQLSQSAHLSLQLPYVIFGLGRLANFVDSLTVSIPVPLFVEPDGPIVTSINGKNPEPAKKSNSTTNIDPFKPLNQSWPMLIPNSQLYVIPYPQRSPKSWKNKLLVTPSQNVIMTAVVLLGTCGVLIIATLVLHWLEKREDRQEKIQEAYRFHFDAM